MTCKSTVTTVTLYDHQQQLDRISIAIVNASPKFAKLLASGEFGRETDKIDGLDASLDIGDDREMHLSIELSKGVKLETWYSCDEPTVELRYAGKNGEKVDEMLNAKVKKLGKMTSLPAFLQAFEDLDSIFDDRDGPDWQGWHSLSFSLKGDALGQYGEIEQLQKMAA